MPDSDEPPDELNPFSSPDVPGPSRQEQVLLEQQSDIAGLMRRGLELDVARRLTMEPAVFDALEQQEFLTRQQAELTQRAIGRQQQRIQRQQALDPILFEAIGLEPVFEDRPSFALSPQLGGPAGAFKAVSRAEQARQPGMLSAAFHDPLIQGTALEPGDPILPFRTSTGATTVPEPAQAQAAPAATAQPQGQGGPIGGFGQQAVQSLLSDPRFAQAFEQFRAQRGG